MLQGHAFATTLEHFAQGHQLAFAKWSVKLRVKLHPSASQLMRDHDLHVATRVFDAALLQISRAAINRFQNRAHPDRHGPCGITTDAPRTLIP